MGNCSKPKSDARHNEEYQVLRQGNLTFYVYRIV